MKGISFCGPHRTGKTTLAKLIVKNNPGIVFVETTTSKIAKGLGIDVSKPMDFETRKLLQLAILSEYEKLFSEATKTNKKWIADRSPLDLLMYTLYDANLYTPTLDIKLFTDRYRESCYAMTNRYFDSLIRIRPGIPMIFEEGKAALDETYINSLDEQLFFLLQSARLYNGIKVLAVPAAMLDLYERLDLCTKFISQHIHMHPDSLNP